MLSPDIKNQLQDHFRSLNAEITLRVYSSQHEKQAELKQMAEDVASCGDRLNL